MKIYNKEQLRKWWPFKCSCGHEDLSENAVGGLQIADTGDYDSCYCPKCGENIDDADALEGVDYQIEGKEYLNCDKCHHEALIQSEYHGKSGGGIDATYECLNCGDTYNVSA